MIKPLRIGEQLKPCPFCGGPVTVRIGIGRLRFFTCRSCGSITSFDSDFCNRNPEQAVNAWNRRADHDPR